MTKPQRGKHNYHHHLLLEAISTMTRPQRGKQHGSSGRLLGHLRCSDVERFLLLLLFVCVHHYRNRARPQDPNNYS